MLTFMEAIARQEGSLKAHPDWHNPGDIEEGPWAQAHGALPSDGSRFAKWPTDGAGFDAMRDLMIYHYVGLTVLEAIQKWAPAVENDTSTYVVNVCNWTGLKPIDVLVPANIG